MIQRIYNLILAFIVGFEFLFSGAIYTQSHYDSQCMDLHTKGAVITVDGIYCYWQINDFYNDYERLDTLLEKQQERDKIKDCQDKNKGKEYICDPRYTPPVIERFL